MVGCRIDTLANAVIYICNWGLGHLLFHNQSLQAKKINYSEILSTLKTLASRCAIGSVLIF